MDTNGATITGVNLKAGKKIQVPSNGAVVNCAGTVCAFSLLILLLGPYASELLATIGLKYPVEHRKRSVFVIDSGKTLPNHLVIDPSGIYWRNEGKHFLAGLAPPNDAACDPDDFTVDHSLFEEYVWPALAYRVPSFESLKVFFCLYSLGLQAVGEFLGWPL